MADKKPTPTQKDPLRDIISETPTTRVQTNKNLNQPQASPATGPQGTTVEDSSSSNADTIENSSLFSDLVLLFGLLLKPGATLQRLFIHSWPKCVITLTCLYCFVPLGANTLLDYSAQYQGLFFLLNRYISISPQTFYSTFFYGGSFSLIVTLLVSSALQHILFLWQRVPISFVQSLATLLYATFPSFLFQTTLYFLDLVVNADFLRSIQLNESNYMTQFVTQLQPGLSLICKALFCCAGVYGLWLWYWGIKSLAGVKMKQLLAVGVLSVLIPVFLLSLILAAYFIWQSLMFTPHTEPFEHLRDALKPR